MQSFEGGTIAPKDGADGTYTLTLEHGLGQTIYFSDRPERIVGASPTPSSSPGSGFSPDNPPNAALVVDDGNGGTDIAVIELTNPAYDEASFTATYDATVLQDWERDAGMELPGGPGGPGCPGPELRQPPTSSSTTAPRPTSNASTAIGSTRANSTRCPFATTMGSACPASPTGITQPDTCATANYWSQKCNSSLDACSSNQCEADFFGRGLVCAL